MTTLGSILVVISALLIIRTVYWFKYQDGGGKIKKYFEARGTRSKAFQTLPEDMAYLKTKIGLLTGEDASTEDENKADSVEHTKNHDSGDNDSGEDDQVDV